MIQENALTAMAGIHFPMGIVKFLSILVCPTDVLGETAMEIASNVHIDPLFKMVNASKLMEIAKIGTKLVPVPHAMQDFNSGMENAYDYLT